MNLEPELLASSLIAFAAIVLSGIFILATTIAFAIIGWKAKLPEPIKMGFAAACSPGLLAFVAFVVFVLTAQVELSILTQKLFELDIIYIAFALFAFLVVVLRGWTNQMSWQWTTRQIERINRERAEQRERAYRETEDKIKRAYK